MRQLATTIVALLMSWLGVGLLDAASATAPAPATPTTASYTYDDLHATTDRIYSATERGPPAAYNNATTYDAVDHRSHGASARLETAGVPGSRTYTNVAPLSHVTRAMATTRAQVRLSDGDSSSDSRAGVAAKAGAGAGDDLTRLYRAVDPAELKDIVGTGVYPSAPGGARRASTSSRPRHRRRTSRT